MDRGGQKGQPSMFDFKRKTQPTDAFSFLRKGVYPPEFNDTFKEYIRLRDNYTCALCFAKSYSLDVHHINYTKYTVKVNCISLCRNCHNMVHARSKEERYRVAMELYVLTKERENVRTVEEIHEAWNQNAH